MTPEQTKTLLAQSIEKAKDDIAALDADGVAAVRAGEEAGEKRAGIFKLLDARAAELAPPAEEPEAAAPIAAKPWQAPDYSGAMTAAQAEWRQHNIKPAKAITK